MDNFSYNSSYPESGHSSPRSREIEYENPTPWDDSQSNQPPPNYKVKFMCSYGGKIQPRPYDNLLSYVGGETKILAVDRTVKFGALLAKLVALCGSDAILFKYQLPGEDLDSLISVTNDDDLEHMMHEYDRLYRVSPKPARLRIFVFPSPNLPVNSSARGFGSGEVKSEEERFVEALNSAPVIAPVQQPAIPAAAAQLQPPPGNADFLFGLEKVNPSVGAQPAHQPSICRVHERDYPVVSPRLNERLIATDSIQKHIQDLQRLRIEEQQGLHQRKSDDTISGVSSGADYFKLSVAEKISQVGSVPYWAEKQVPSGVFPSSTTALSNDHPIYMIPAPAGPYHPPMVRPMNAAPSQGYYTLQRIPPDVNRDQQQQQPQHMYGMIYGGVPSSAAAPPQVAGYSDGLQMIRPGTASGMGMVPEAASYAQVAFDSGTGRQVIYSAPGIQGAAQYHVLGSPVGAGESRQQSGVSTAEAAGKLSKTQGSV